VDTKNILAVGVNGMVPTLILVDQNQSASIQQNDARSRKSISLELCEEKIFSCAQGRDLQQSIGPKLLWLSRINQLILKEPFMGSYDYINFRLTGSSWNRTGRWKRSL
jgi:sugar (pentulose or hexulose) kinase